MGAPPALSLVLAVEALYAKDSGRLRRRLRRHRVPPQDVDDVVQEYFALLLARPRLLELAATGRLTTDFVASWAAGRVNGHHTARPGMSAWDQEPSHLGHAVTPEAELLARQAVAERLIGTGLELEFAAALPSRELAPKLRRRRWRGVKVPPAPGPRRHPAVEALLADGKWHSQVALRRVGGARVGRFLLGRGDLERRPGRFGNAMWRKVCPDTA